MQSINQETPTIQSLNNLDRYSSRGSRDRDYEDGFDMIRGPPRQEPTDCSLYVSYRLHLFCVLLRIVSLRNAGIPVFCRCVSVIRRYDNSFALKSDDTSSKLDRSDSWDIIDDDNKRSGNIEDISFSSKDGSDDRLVFWRELPWACFGYIYCYVMQSLLC